MNRKVRFAKHFLEFPLLAMAAEHKAGSTVGNSQKADYKTYSSVHFVT